MADTEVISSLLMDRDFPIGNSPGADARHALHTKVKNTLLEPIPVTVTGGSSAVTVNQYGEASSVGSAALTTVTSYVVPPSKTLLLSLVEASGTNIAAWDVSIDGTTIAKKYTYFGGGLSASFSFSDPGGAGLSLPSGTTIRLRVIHSRPDLGDFAGRIVGHTI